MKGTTDVRLSDESRRGPILAAGGGQASLDAASRAGGRLRPDAVSGPVDARGPTSCGFTTMRLSGDHMGWKADNTTYYKDRMPITQHGPRRAPL